MRDIEDRIRDSAPSPESLSELSVENLVRRARRRTQATRAAAGAGALGLVALAAITFSAIRPTGDVKIDPLEPGTNAPAPDETSPSASDVSSDRPPAEPSASEGEILEEPEPGMAEPALPGGPAAGVCSSEGAPDGVATIVIGPDVPQPRCLQVLPGQTLRIVNGTSIDGEPDMPGETVTAGLGDYRFRVDPGEEVLLYLPVSNYLEPGVHRIESDYAPAGGEVWVLQAPSASLGQQAVLDALLAFARDPSDATFDQLPLADEVALGTGGELSLRRAAAELRDSEAWLLEDGVSALTALAGAPDRLVFTIGERPHCGEPMPLAPDEFAHLTRASIQVPPSDGCESWFVVDLYVDEDGTGRIHGVTVDR